jgi:hypothetical protein
VLEEKPAAVPPLGEIREKVLSAWRLEEARKALVAKASAARSAGDLKALGEVKTQEPTTLSSLGELGQHPGIRQALLKTAPGELTPVLWNPDGQVWLARIKARTSAEPMGFAERQALLRELQGAVSQRMLGAEIQDLDSRGRMRPGFSSLWGRLDGIWINPAAKSQPGDVDLSE